MIDRAKAAAVVWVKNSKKKGGDTKVVQTKEFCR